MMIKKVLHFVLFALLALLACLIIFMFYPENKLPKEIKIQVGSNSSNVSASIDSILINKSSRRMMVFQKGIVLKTYTVSLGGNPIGHKEKRGDNRTPEGLYHIANKTTHTAFHKTLILSYPNKVDRAAARKKGVDPGSGIEIHGLAKRWVRFGKLHRLSDWTRGCIAVTNEEIDEIYEYVEKRCPVLITP
jgi:murein L,D-transpeptidase YafK